MQKTKKRHVRLSNSTVPRVNIRLIFVEMNNANLLAYSYLVHLYLVYLYLVYTYYLWPTLSCRKLISRYLHLVHSSTCILSTVMHKTGGK